MVKIIAVQIGNDRVIALRENGPHNWRIYVDTESYEVDDATLLSPSAMDAACKLKLSFYERSNYLLSLLAAFNRAGVKLAVLA